MCVDETMCQGTCSECMHDLRTRIEAETVAAIVARLRNRADNTRTASFFCEPSEAAAVLKISTLLSDEADAIERNDWKRGG